MAKKLRENRVPIMMSEEEVSLIDEWRFNYRIATRSDAIRRLCRIGLEADAQAPNLLKSISVTSKTCDEMQDIVIQEKDSDGKKLQHFTRSVVMEYFLQEAKLLRDTLRRVSAFGITVLSMKRPGTVEAALKETDQWHAKLRSVDFQGPEVVNILREVAEGIVLPSGKQREASNQPSDEVENFTLPKNSATKAVEEALSYQSPKSIK